jgi:hypothetical protein
MWFQALKVEWKTGKTFHSFCEDEMLEIYILDEIITGLESIDKRNYFETLSLLLGGGEKKSRQSRQHPSSMT